jgi:hypothetical protein
MRLSAEWREKYFQIAYGSTKVAAGAHFNRVTSGSFIFSPREVGVRGMGE